MRSTPILAGAGLLLAATVPVSAAIVGLDEPIFVIRPYVQTLPQELDSLKAEGETAWGQIQDRTYDPDSLETDNAFRVGVDLVSVTPLGSSGIVSFIGCFGGSYGRQEIDQTDDSFDWFWDFVYNQAIFLGDPLGVTASPLETAFFADAMRSDTKTLEIESFQGNLKLGIGIHPLSFLHVEVLGQAGAGFTDAKEIVKTLRYPFINAAWNPFAQPLPFSLMPSHTTREGESDYGVGVEYGGQVGVYFDLGILQLGAFGGYLWQRQWLEDIDKDPGMTIWDFAESGFIDNETIRVETEGFFAGVSAALIF